MKSYFLLLVIGFSFCASANGQDKADSLYELAWDKFNHKEYHDAAELFEESISAGKTWSGTYMNAASAWAFANEKEKTFENLQRLVGAGYLDKNFIVLWFSEFYKYHELDEWKDLMHQFDIKREEFYAYADTQEFLKMNKVKMYQDFDSLTMNLIKISPHLKVREELTGMDYKNYFNKLRQEIEKCTSTDKFSLLIKRVLMICQDGHTSLVSLNPFEHLSNGKSMEFCASIAKYEQLFYDNMVTREHLPLLVYHKGGYYLAEEFNYLDYHIPAKSELIQVNNFSPKDYISNHLDLKRSLSWDFNNECYYSESFLQQNIASDSLLQLTFVTTSEPITVPLNLKLGYLPPKLTKVNNGFVWYWDQQKILYIRMPRMVNGNYYVEEIKKYSDKSINKIIIDVRQNPGGSDYDWEDVLGAISNLNLEIRADYAYNKESVNNADSSWLDYQKFPELDLVYTTVRRDIGSDDYESINYQGNIYIFYDNSTFSAAGSLVSTCYYSDHLVSVGEPTGRIMGFGTNPKEFELFNSKLRYRVAPVLDITAVNSYKDLFHDQPEMDVNLTLNEKILLKQNPFNIDFLKNQDPYMKKITNLN